MRGLRGAVTLLIAATLSCVSSSKETEPQKHWLEALSERLFKFISPSSVGKETAVLSLAGESSSPIPAMSTSTSSLSDDDVKKLVEQAATMIQSGQIEQAVDNLLPVIETKPGHLLANSYMGAILLGLEQYNSSETFLVNAVIGSNWTDLSAVMNFAKLQQYRGDWELAARSLLQGLNATSALPIEKSTKARMSASLGDCFFGNGSYAQAAEWYLSAATMAPEETAYWVQASTVRFPPAGQNYSLAEMILLQAVTAKSDEPDLLFHLGLVFFATERTSEALIFFEQSLRLRPEHVETLGAAATAYHSLRKAEPALQLYRRAIAASVNQPNAALLANFAMLLNLSGQKDEALQIAKEGQKIQADHPEVIRALQEIGDTI